MDDNLLQAIQQMKNGEEKGFNKVYSVTRDGVYRMARKMTRTEEEAMDVTQAVYMEAYKNIHTLKASEAFISWLYGITHNQAMKLSRKRRDDKEYLVGEDLSGIFEAQESFDTATMPELTADQKATAEIVKGIIDELPVLQKEAVIAYYYDGLKVEEIAEAASCSVNTVKSRLNYARKYIRERVEEKEEKEGYRLHVLGLPVLWYALHSMAEETKLTVQAAQQIYDGACYEVGLQPTAISAASDGAGTMAAEAVSQAGEAAVSAGAAETAAGTAAAAGTGAGIASLSMTAKMLIAVGGIAAVGLGAAGIIRLTAPPTDAGSPEPTEVIEVLADTTATETPEQESPETMPTETVTSEETTETEETTEAAQAYDYHVMAQAAAELMNSLQAQGVFSEDNEYFINDIDKDGVPELILCRGNSNADYEYAIYSFDGTDLTEKTTTPWGSVVYGYFDEQAMAIRYVQMGYELIHYYNSVTNETTLISEKELMEDANGDYAGGYEFPFSAYRMTAYTQRDEDSLYKNIMSIVQ